MNVHCTAVIFLALLAVLSAPSRAQSLVYNGDFEEVGEDGAPEGWQASGRSEIEQTLSVADDPQRGRVARLVCTRFVPGSPSSHAMLAQTDHVGVRGRQWYRLRLWAKGSDIEGGIVRVGLSNTRNWSNTGLSDSFVPPAQWQQFEFVFQAAQDLPPEDSRLQIWYGSTGTLWLDEVVLEETTAVRREWRPVLPLDGTGNALPNSSFECGGSGWGCWSPEHYSWGANIFRLLGDWEEGRAFHGGHSWRLSLTPDTQPVAYFDYYDPVEAPMRAVLLGHEGWVSVQRGQPYVFSAYVMADRPDVPVRVTILQADGPSRNRLFSVGEDWQRVELSFEAATPYACGFVGLDFREADQAEGTIWLDAVQFEAGPTASPYRPRLDLETRLATERTGNVFLDPDAGMDLLIMAHNASGSVQTVRGSLTVTDFMGRAVWEAEPEMVLPAGRSAAIECDGVLARNRGFFRVRWEPEGDLAQEMRCAVIEPSAEDDSIFGMNHAFSWEFLLELSHAAGIRWWRDWSVKWQTVQPKPDGFDFRVPDAQIDRVLDVGGRVLVLFPFPSAVWAATPAPEKMDAAAEGNSYLRERLPTAFKPDRLEDFAAYIRAGVEHYGSRIHEFEILNEALYTTYSLPARFGYGMSDYIDILRTAYEAAKAADPDCTVVGGLGGGPSADWLNQFIEQGGMKWCDVLNYHIYPHKGWPESYEEDLRLRWEQLNERGEARPIWMTEFGLYADDDPPFTPFRVGDTTMNNTLRPTELTASADLVRFAAILCAHGVRKIFYHAGTCAALHQSSAGNLFFRYGGMPRKQFGAQAALSLVLGPDFEFVRKWDEPEWVWAYEFRSRGRSVVILWTRKSDAPPLAVPDGFRALDLMGNPFPGRELAVGDVPVYFVGD